MAEEKKKSTAKELIDMMIIVSFVCLCVAHLNSAFKPKSKTETVKSANKERIMKNDSIRTDSIPTVNFVKNQIQQKVK